MQSAKSVVTFVRLRSRAAGTWLLSCCLLACTSPPPTPRAEVQTSNLEPKTVCDADSDCFYRPAKCVVPTPALIILSCTGATAADLDSNTTIADSLGWILATCHGSRNHRSTQDNEHDILRTFGKLLRNYSVDRNRVFICGFSGMGLQACYELARNPTCFRGVCAACSPFRGLPEPEPNALSGHVAYLVTRTDDWNRDANRALARWFETRGVQTMLKVTPGEHQVGDTRELLEGCAWLKSNTE